MTRWLWISAGLGAGIVGRWVYWTAWHWPIGIAWVAAVTVVLVAFPWAIAPAVVLHMAALVGVGLFADRALAVDR